MEIARSKEINKRGQQMKKRTFLLIKLLLGILRDLRNDKQAAQKLFTNPTQKYLKYWMIILTTFVKKHITLKS